MRATTGSAAGVPGVPFTLGDQSLLENWAPVGVMHAVRALADCGVPFTATGLLHRRVTSQSVTAAANVADGTAMRYTILHRLDTATVGGGGGANWKVKYTLPVS